MLSFGTRDRDRLVKTLDHYPKVAGPILTKVQIGARKARDWI